MTAWELDTFDDLDLVLQQKRAIQIPIRLGVRTIYLRSSVNC